MKSSQVEQVETILKRKRKIDNFWCLDTRLTIRLSSIINRLRGRGWHIKTVMVGQNCVYKLVKAV